MGCTCVNTAAQPKHIDSTDNARTFETIVIDSENDEHCSEMHQISENSNDINIPFDHTNSAVTVSEFSKPNNIMKDTPSLSTTTGNSGTNSNQTVIENSLLSQTSSKAKTNALPRTYGLINGIQNPFYVSDDEEDSFCSDTNIASEQFTLQRAVNDCIEKRKVAKIKFVKDKSDENSLFVPQLKQLNPNSDKLKMPNPPISPLLVVHNMNHNPFQIISTHSSNSGASPWSSTRALIEDTVGGKKWNGVTPLIPAISTPNTVSLCADGPYVRDCATDTPYYDNRDDDCKSVASNSSTYL